MPIDDEIPLIIGDFLDGLILFDPGSFSIGNERFWLISSDRSPLEFFAPFEQDDTTFGTGLARKDLAEFGGQLFLSGLGLEEESELFKLTPSGNWSLVDIDPSTPQVDTIFPGDERGKQSDPRGFVEVDDRLYFAAETPQFGRLVLWQIDPAGSVSVVDLLPQESGTQAIAIPADANIQDPLAQIIRFTPKKLPLSWAYNTLW